MRVEVTENEIELKVTCGDVSLYLDKRTDKVDFDTPEIEYSVLNKMFKALKKARNKPQLGELDD